MQKKLKPWDLNILSIPREALMLEKEIQMKVTSFPGGNVIQQQSKDIYIDMERNCSILILWTFWFRRKYAVYLVMERLIGWKPFRFFWKETQWKGLHMPEKCIKATNLNGHLERWKTIYELAKYEYDERDTRYIVWHGSALSFIFNHKWSTRIHQSVHLHSCQTRSQHPLIHALC